VTNQKTYLVTGYKGYIGRNIYNYLKTFDNIEVDGFSRNDNFQNKQYDIIVHCAGSTPSKINDKFDYIKNNINLTKRVIDKYPNSKIIFLSTKDIYGTPNTDSIIEETIPYNQSFYGMSKHLSEQLIIDKSINYIILRLPAIIGLNSPRTFITEMIDNIMGNKEIVLYNGEKKFNSIIHIDNLISIVKYMTNTDILNPRNEIYNISSTGSIFLKNIPLLIADKLNINIKNIKNTATSDVSSLFSSAKIQKILDLDSVDKTIIKYLEELQNEQ
jgi:nucleoside-diphosphate-sugar epimerase